MKKFILVAACMLLAGCVNLYTRCPGTNTKIVQTYQSTYVASGLSYVVMFPQVMFPSGNAAFIPENLISIPVGCLGFVDTACEAVVDTVLFPADYAISRSRNEKMPKTFAEKAINRD
jgi:uncharacterized protein YceK